MKNEKNDLNSIKAVIQRLINNGQHHFAHEILNNFREKTNYKDFYSMEMATFFSMRMAYEKAIIEYLLFLEHNPKKNHVISDRILAFPDTPDNIININSYLQKSSLKEAKFILADFKFKTQEYENGYDLLKKNNAPSIMLLDYAKDLASIKEFLRAEKILMEIIESKENESLMTLAIFEIAKILESKIIINKTFLPISNYHSNNPFLSSPYLPVKESSTIILDKTMNIYDSLRVTKKNAQASYRLAEVQFRILGDLDGAYYLYNEAYSHGNTEGLRLDAALGMINIYISKGDLNKAEKLIKELKKENQNKIEFELKLAQINFYKGNLIETEKMIKTIIKDLPSNHLMYNDMLNIISILIAFKNNEEEFVTFANIQLNIQQNNRIEAIEKLIKLFDSNEIYISEMCKFQQAWLLYLQNELEIVEQKLEEITEDTIYKEMAFIFKAEILDHVKKDLSKAIDAYLSFLNNYPNSIYYDDIRLRLRELAS
jgi:tetratricopeptide (TPR) repeat protein